MANKITTVLDLDGSKFGRGIKQAIDQVKQADGALNKVKAAWTGAVAAFTSSPAAMAGAAVGVGAFVKATSDAASSLEESINAVNTAYGTNADLVHQLGEQSAESFGLSQRAFNQFAGQFESFAHKIAAAGGENPAAVLEDLATRISDFASNKDLDLSEASRVIQSALAGETEAFRRYGGDVSAVTVTQRALEMQLAETASGLTEQDKILARYSLIMEQTNKVAGDFANTIESQANQERVAAANAENLAASIGNKLTPVIADALSTMNHLVSIIDELSNRAPGGGGGPIGTIVGGAINPLEAFAGALDYVNGKLAELDEMVGGTNGRVTDGIKSWKLAAEAAEGWTSAHVKATEKGQLSADTVANLKAQQDRYVGSLIDAGQAVRDEAAAEAERAKRLEDANALLGRQIDHLHDYERAQFDVADAQDRLSDAQADLNELLTEGTVSAAEKARADQDIVDAQVAAFDATQDLADAQRELDRVIASSIPTDEDKADSLRKVEDAQRDLEAAIRGVDDANRDVQNRERRLAELRAELAEVNGPQLSAETKNSPEFKAAKERADLDKKRADLVLDIADAELDLTDAHRDVQDAYRDVDDATQRASEIEAEHQRLLTQGINVDDAKRDATDRVTAAERRLAEANAAVGAAQQARSQLLRDSIPTDAEKEAATRDVERAELDLVVALEGQATAFANQKGAVDGTTTSLALQRQELERIIALNPALAAALQPAIDLQTAMGAGAIYSQLPVTAREPSLIVNINGLVLDPVGVGRAVTDAQNAFYRSGGYGTINPRLQ